MQRFCGYGSEVSDAGVYSEWELRRSVAAAALPLDAQVSQGGVGDGEGCGRVGSEGGVFGDWNDVLGVRGIGGEGRQAAAGDSGGGGWCFE